MDILGTVDVVMTKLHRSSEHGRLPPGVHTNFKFLREEFLMICDPISYPKSVEEPIPKEWVLALREVAYDMEDSLDLFLIHVNSPTGVLSIARKLISLPSSTSPRDTLYNKLKNLKERLMNLNDQRKLYLYQLDEAPIETHRPGVDPRLSALYQETDGLVGLTGPIEEVTRMVTKNKAGLMTICIVGMVGSGKTTLAKQVYKRLGEEKCFECQAFVSLGQELNLKKTLMDMLSMLVNEHQVDEDINEHQVNEDIDENLIMRFRQTLKRKRYLIVVDDLCKFEHHWTTMKHCFPENSLGSRVITTTMDVRLANALATASDCIYNIGLLSEVDSKNLVLTRAFGTGLGCPQDLEDYFAKIITRCGGLPLALVMVASMLRDQSSMGEWGTLAESRWSLISHPHAETMKQILNLSYNDLRPQLRTCLLYLSIFPENYEVDVDRLARRWIAEGFIFKGHHTNKEDLAISYLSELFGKNMVQPLHLNYEGWPRYCRLHPVIHDFLVCKSMEEKFAIVVNVQDDQNFPNNNGIVRRLSLQSNPNEDQAMARNDYTDLSQARTISVFGRASSTPHLTDVKMVRVLDLEGCVGPVCLDGLSTLLFLRYLSLRGTGVSELPATIGELRCLETMDVSSTKVKKLPPSIGALLYLSYLNIRDTDVSELPETIGELRYLETLDIRSTKVKELPPSILNLKRSLKAIFVGSESSEGMLRTLGGLNGLRVLKITWSTQQPSERAYEALVSSIENWIHLESFTIHCGFLCSMEFLGSLTNPPQSLKKFKVTAGRFVVVPQWINGLEFLSFMQTTVCKVGSGDLRILKDLPRLKFLILGLEFIPREAIVIENEGFSELTKFSVDCPVPWLTFSTEAMPKLTHLELKFCSGPAAPQSVPSGISNLRSLREVVLCYNQKWCASSSSVKMTVAAVKEEVSRHRNPVELVINGTRVDVQQAEEATEIQNVAEHGGKAKDNVEAAGEGTSKISSSGIEEIEDDAEHGL